MNWCFAEALVAPMPGWVWELHAIDLVSARSMRQSPQKHQRFPLAAPRMNIILRQWSYADAEDLICICNAVDRRWLTNRLPYPYTHKDATAWLNVVAEKFGETGLFYAIVVNGQTVGNISLECKDDVYSRDAEIGYFLAPQYYAKGIATEAVRQLCGSAFADIGLLRITGRVCAPNTASAKVLKNNGFTLEGTMKNAVFKNGEIYDLHLYGRCI